MKIAVLSDVHENYNSESSKSDIIGILTNWIKENKPDVFILAGDITTGPDKGADLLCSMQREVPDTKLLFVHGNHDIFHEDSRAAYEKLLQFPGNLGNGPVKLSDKWVVIGDGGWYDYSFGMEGYTAEEFAAGTQGNFTWPDKKFAHWNESDISLTRSYLTRLEGWLNEYKNKNIIFVTHFVPYQKFIQYKDDPPAWNFFNAFIGSRSFGELAKKYHVKKYIFGHIHTRHEEDLDGIHILCNPLGYYPHEWVTQSAEEEIPKTIKVIEID